MTLVDTSVWIDYFRGKETSQTNWLDERIETDRLATLDLIICECLQGASTDREADLLLRELRKLSVFETNLDLAIESAQNFRELRSRGYTVRSTIDSLIATFCIQTGIPLLHRDRDFGPFQVHLGLKVIDL